MAMAADIVVVEVEELLDEPLNPNHVIIPGVVVDYIVESKKEK